MAQPNGSGSLRAVLDEHLAWGDAIAPFFDKTLDRRIRDARDEWIEEAQESIDAQTDADLEVLREQAVARLAEYREQIQELLESVRVDADMFELPDVPDVPEPVLDGDQPGPLCDSRWDFDEQCRELIASKNCSNGDGI